MKKSLNLRFDEKVVEAAKRYANQHNTSVSDLVEKYFLKLTSGKRNHYISEDIEGCLKEFQNYSDEDLRAEYLKERHGV